MACPIESTNGIVIECQDCINQLEAVIKSDTERSIRDKWNGSGLEGLAHTNTSRRGEIAGYEWIIYKITGEFYSKNSRINGIIKWDEFGNPNKTIFDKEKV